MKRLLSSFMFVGIVAALAGGAAAAREPLHGVNLTWSNGDSLHDCWSGANGHQLLATWACDTDAAGPWTLVGSFRLWEDMPQFLVISATLDAQSVSANLPDWWQVWNPGSCRQSSLTVSSDFRSGYSTATCHDPLGGKGSGGIGAWQTTLYPPPAPLNVPRLNRWRLKCAWALQTSRLLSATYEWYAFSATFDAAHTATELPLCGGCDVPVSIVLNEIQLLPETGLATAETLTEALDNSCVYWQAADPSICPHVAVRARTWGQLKSLYR